MNKPKITDIHVAAIEKLTPVQAYCIGRFESYSSTDDEKLVLESTGMLFRENEGPYGREKTTAYDLVKEALEGAVEQCAARIRDKNPAVSILESLISDESAPDFIRDEAKKVLASILRK